MMDIETYIIGYLNDVGLSAAAYPYPPKNSPDTLITVERTGGAATRFIDRPVVAIQSWAQSKLAACELASEVDDAIMNGIVDGSLIVACERNSLVSYPSEDREPRYQAVYDLIVNKTI